MKRVINAFETWCWRRILKIKWTDRIKNDEVFQRAKEERLLLKILKSGCHSWIGHTIRHNELVVNIFEGAISGKKTVGRPRLQYLKQVARNTEADSYTAMKRMAGDNPRWKAAKKKNQKIQG
jgi:porphobilinogen deaminase